MSFPSFPGKARAAAVVAGSALAAVILVEALLELSGAGASIAPVGRSVRLREAPPATSRTYRPTELYLQGTDSLELADYPFRTDRDGWIEPSRVHERPDLTALFLGGSTTECRYVPEQERFVYLSGRRLEQRLGQKINTLNGGVSGNNAMHSAINLLAKGIEAKPDFAILMHAVNDLTILAYNHTYFNRHSVRSLIIRDQHRYASGSLGLRARGILELAFPELYRLTVAVHDQAQAALGADPNEWAGRRIAGAAARLDQERIVASFRNALETFCRSSKAWGVEPVLMTQPSRVTAEPDELMRKLFARGPGRYGAEYGDWFRAYEALNRTTRETAGAEGAPLIDLAKGIPASSRYIYDAVHLNTEGSRLAAGYIARRLATIARQQRIRSGAADDGADARP